MYIISKKNYKSIDFVEFASIESRKKIMYNYFGDINYGLQLLSLYFEDEIYKQMGFDEKYRRGVVKPAFA